MYGELYLEQKLVLIKATYIVVIYKIIVLKVELLVQISPVLFGYTSI